MVQSRATFRAIIVIALAVLVLAESLPYIRRVWSPSTREEAVDSRSCTNVSPFGSEIAPIESSFYQIYFNLF